MNNLKQIVITVGLLSQVSAAAWAFTPDGGLWTLANEAPDQPGRGLTIDVQNDIMALTVYGYTTNGDSTFYLASGPLNDNIFEAALGQYQGGTQLGGATKPAAWNGSAGTVKVTFTSGIEGTITLPGEQPVAIQKMQFGYDYSNAKALLGLWFFNHYYYTLNTIVEATKNGTGVATNGPDKMPSACEYQRSGNAQGYVVCSFIRPYDYAYSAKTYPTTDLHSSRGKINRYRLNFLETENIQKSHLVLFYIESPMKPEILH